MNSKRKSSRRRTREINALGGWRRWVLRPLCWVHYLWCRTLRIHMEPEDRALLQGGAGAALLLLWHNRLFLAGLTHRSHRGGRRVRGLVSASRDGAWLAEYFALEGVETIRGSSSFRSREALEALTASLREGVDVAVTPDGPRGPMYDFKPGVLAAVRKSGSGALLLGFRFSRAWNLRSWDQFFLPAPFSRVEVRCRLLEEIEGEDLNDFGRRARRLLLEVNGEPVEEEQGAGGKNAG